MASSTCEKVVHNVLLFLLFKSLDLVLKFSYLPHKRVLLLARFHELELDLNSAVDFGLLRLDIMQKLVPLREHVDKLLMQFRRVLQQLLEMPSSASSLAPKVTTTVVVCTCLEMGQAAACSDNTRGPPLGSSCSAASPALTSSWAVEELCS